MVSIEKVRMLKETTKSDYLVGCLKIVTVQWKRNF